MDTYLDHEEIENMVFSGQQYLEKSKFFEKILKKKFSPELEFEL